MLQEVDGIEVYVVEFDTMPELPITGVDYRERIYANALSAAIRNGIITEPGKYGIEVIEGVHPTYEIYRIIE